jgi:glycerol-3-phosphate dehydrogenase
MKRRDDILRSLRDAPLFWDIIVIGGGATGFGAAVDAAARGYRTILLEQSDFSKGTSSRSTKLIHGGVRYLQQGNVRLVLEALRERGTLLRNAPHLVRNLPFIVPNYDWWEGPFYGVGLKIYDMLSGRFGLGPSMHVSRRETLQQIPTLEPGGLRGGILYHDAQFDDARLVVNLAQTLADLGGTPVNYMQVIHLLKAKGCVDGVVARDMEGGEEFEIRGRVVVNATGVFTDAVLRMDDPGTPDSIVPSQGVHIVLEKAFLPSESAVMVPHTRDGRVLFALPWHDRVVVGTTDTPVAGVSLEPRPLREEITFLLAHAARYLTRDPSESDVLSAFAGLRPLVKTGHVLDTASLSREHAVHVSGSGLVTVTGGKWTTYRKMGEDVINRAADVAGLNARRPETDHLRIHGWIKHETDVYPWDVYGTDIVGLKKIAAENRAWGETLHPKLFYRVCEVIWAVRNEWARTVEDVLARRTRALFLDARASMEAAPAVARLMAGELGRDPSWEAEQVRKYVELAEGYLA